LDAGKGGDIAADSAPVWRSSSQSAADTTGLKWAPDTGAH
jgi:hypothetical protein